MGVGFGMIFRDTALQVKMVCIFVSRRRSSEGILSGSERVYRRVKFGFGALGISDVYG